MASPENAKLVKLLRDNAAPVSDYETMLAKVDKIRSNFDASMSSFKVADDITVETVNAGGVPAEFLTPPGADMDRVVLYVHGGGYVIGSVNTHRHMISELARASNCRALAVDYRLAPEHIHPAAVDDATAAYGWLLDQGISNDKIVVSGDSAGGGLTMATLLALRDAGAPLPAGGAPISPWVDLAGTGESMQSKADLDPMVEKIGLTAMGRIYVGDGDLYAPLAAPLNADLNGLPPLLIQVGEWEVLLDDATRLADKAKAAGVDVTLEVWDEMVHVWHLFYQMLPEGKQAIDRIGEFVKQRTG